MRLFDLLAGGWSINFSQQTLGVNTGALSLGQGAFMGLLRRPRVELEIERYRRICENVTIDSASKMTGVDELR
jgi:hypothetical protein